MVKRYKPGFSRSEIIQKLQIACFYMKKTCQNVPTVLKCRTKSTPYLPFYYIFPPEFEISQFLGWIKSPRLRLGDFIQPKNCEISNSGGNIFCEIIWRGSRLKIVAFPGLYLSEGVICQCCQRQMLGPYLSDLRDDCMLGVEGGGAVFWAQLYNQRVINDSQPSGK